MPELKQLYQEMILDHNKNPRNFKEFEHPTHQSEGYNPLCGDHYNLYLQVEDGKIVDVGFEGAGCAISKSSASIMTTCLKGSTVEEADQMLENFHRMLTEETSPGELPGVKAFPTRIKCATVVWHTMKSALEGKEEISTEE